MDTLYYLITLAVVAALVVAASRTDAPLDGWPFASRHDRPERRAARRARGARSR